MPKDRYISGITDLICRFVQKFAARISLWMLGCHPGLIEYEEPDIDYKKYLGPDWEPSQK